MRILKYMGIVVGVLGLLLSGWLLYKAWKPTSRDTHCMVLDLSYACASFREELGLDSVSAFEESPGLLDGRNCTLTLNLPRSLTVGGQETITLTLQDPSALLERCPEWKGYSIIVLAVSRGSNFEMRPKGTLAEPWLTGRSVTFEWMAEVPSAGEYPMNLALHLRFLPVEGGAPIECPLWAQSFILPTETVLGLDQPTALHIGLLGITVSGIMLVFCSLKGSLKQVRKG